MQRPPNNLKGFYAKKTTYFVEAGISSADFSADVFAFRNSLFSDSTLSNMKMSSWNLTSK